MNKKKKKDQHNKVEKLHGEYSNEVIKLVRVLLIVLVIFGAMYLITSVILNDSDTTTSTDNDTEETYIQYDEVLAGESFSINNEEYIIVYYDKTSDDSSMYTNAISGYSAGGGSLPIYSVDTSNALNKSYVSDNGNNSAKTIGELKVSSPTLIVFRNGEVSEYHEKEEVLSYLQQ